MQNLYEKHSNLEDELDYTKQMYDELMIKYRKF